MTELRKIVGAQVHHSQSYADAEAGLIKGRMGLKGALRRTGNPEIEEIDKLIGEAQHRTSRLREAASREMQALWDSDPDRFIRCREGAEPWPGETLIGFEPACTCYDPCIQHFDRSGEARTEDEAAEQAEIGWRCKCTPCPVPDHAEAA